MQLGSPEHKAQMCQDLIKTYHENIWKDEMYLIQLEEIKGDKRKEIAAIELDLENKEYSNAKEAKQGKQALEKAKFVAERELAQIEGEIKKISEQVNAIWPARIRLVQEYLAKDQA